MMDSSINKHNIALITGSSSGLGFEVAKALDKNGVQLLLTGRSKERLSQARNKLSKKIEHRIFCGDLSNDDYLTQITQEIIDSKVIPNIIIHNLGGKISGDNHPLTNDILQQSIQFNLGISVKLNSCLFPKMIENKNGRIIHISSDSSLSGQASPGYVAAKASINGYVKSTARFYAKHNIMLCAVLPGIFEHEDSDWSKKKLEQPDYYNKKISQMPLERFGRVDELANIIAELACSKSMMCSGSLIELTGAY